MSVGWGQCNGCNPNITEYYELDDNDNYVRRECIEWVSNVNDCSQSNIDFLNDIILLNESFDGQNPLDIGSQFWLMGELTFFYFETSSDIVGELTLVPESIGNLSNLIILDIRECNISELPTSIGNLTNLEGLFLEENNLTNLPTSLGNLNNLTILDLEDNDLFVLPETIDGLTSLQGISLIGNQLTNIPNSFWNLTNLNFLDIRDNQLTQLSDDIGNLVNLEYLNVRNNSLTTISDSFCSIYSNLIDIDVSNNYLCPPFPSCLSETEIGNQNSTDCFPCPDCSLCSESYSYIEGIPESCESDDNCFFNQDLQFLQDLIDNSQQGDNPPPSNLNPLELGFQWWFDKRLGTLFSVSQTKMLEMGIQPSFFSNTQVFYDNLTYFELSGEIPSSISNLDENTFYFLGLGFNSLIGEIPNELGNFNHLDVIWMNHNELNGNIPVELENLTGLGSLWLSNNQLTGEFPNIFWNNNDIDGIYLNNNNFEGSFNIELDSTLLNWGEFQYLTINISNNDITEIDNSICNIIDDIESIYIGGNNICDEEPVCLQNMMNYCYDEFSETIYLTPQNTSECFECSETNGDINNDNILDILDIVSTVNCILSDNCNECSDMNGDEIIDILDIVLMVNDIMDI